VQQGLERDPRRLPFEVLYLYYTIRLHNILYIIICIDTIIFIETTQLLYYTTIRHKGSATTWKDGDDHDAAQEPQPPRRPALPQQPPRATSQSGALQQPPLRAPAPSGAEYRAGIRALASHHHEHLAIRSYLQEDRRRAEPSISPQPDRRRQRRSRSRRRSITPRQSRRGSRSRRRSITPRQSRRRSGSRRRSITPSRSRGSNDLEWTIRTINHLIFVFQDAREVLYRMRI
jgi:hypothetical protein